MKHVTLLSRSDRLQSLFDCLSSGEEKTTKQIADMTGSVAVHSDVTDLRNNRIIIDCRFVRMNGRNRIYGYKMVKKLEESKV